MSTDSVGTDERGISEIYGTILVIALAFAVSVLIVGAGFLLLDDSLDSSSDKQAEDSVLEFGDRVSTVVDAVEQNGSWEPPQGTAENFEAQSGQGKINITVRTTDKYWTATENTSQPGKLVNAGNQTNNETITVGTLRYEGEDGRVTSYQGGAVFRKQDDRVKVLRTPDIEVSEEQLELNLVNISSMPPITEGQELTIDGGKIDTNAVQNVVDAAIQRNGQPVAEAEINMTVTSEYAEGWAAYAEEELDDVTVWTDLPELDDNQVKFGFGTRNDGINVSHRLRSDGIIYSGLTEYASDLHALQSSSGAPYNLSDRNPGFALTEPSGFTVNSDYEVGIRYAPNGSNDRDWWKYNESDGKWVNIEDPGDGALPTSQVSANGSSDPFKQPDDIWTCVVDKNEVSGNFRGAVDEVGKDCLEDVVSVEGAGNETAEFEPRLDIDQLLVSSGPVEAPETITINASVMNTGTGDATGAPVGIYVVTDNGTYIRDGTNSLAVDRGDQKWVNGTVESDRFIRASTSANQVKIGTGTPHDSEFVNLTIQNPSRDAVFDIDTFSVNSTTEDVVETQTIKGNLEINNVGNESASAVAKVYVEGDPTNATFVGFDNVDNGSSKSEQFVHRTRLGNADDGDNLVAEIDGNTSKEDITIYPPNRRSKFVIEDTTLATNDPITAGSPLTVSAVVNNTGVKSDYQSVSLRVKNPSAPDLLTDSQNVSLNPGETQTVNLQWPTRESDAGDAIVVMETYDEAAATNVTVKEIKPPDLNVSIDASATPITQLAGNDLNVTIDVVNGEGQEVTDEVWLSVENVADGTKRVVDGRPVTVGANSTKTVDLTWETTLDDVNGDLSEYNVTVTTDSDDDTTTVDLTSPSAADLEFTDIGPASQTVTEGDPVTVNVTVENDGPKTGTTVSLETIEDVPAAAKDITVGANGQTEVSLTWNTLPGDAGSGEVTARLSSNKTISADVTVEPLQVKEGRNPVDVVFALDETGSMGVPDYGESFISGPDETIDNPSGEYIVPEDEIWKTQEETGCSILGCTYQDLRQYIPGDTVNADQDQVDRIAIGEPDSAGNDPLGDRIGATKVGIAGLDSTLGDRAGVLEYDVSQNVYQPVTADFDAVNESLRINPGGNTNIAGAIDKSEEELDDAAGDRSKPHDKVMIVLTDGVHNEGPSPITEAENVDEDVTIYTVGFGNADSTTLESIADGGSGEGRYFEAENSSQLKEIFEQVIKNATDQERPKFDVDIKEGEINDTEADIGQTIEVPVEIENIGEVGGERVVTLSEQFNGNLVDSTVQNLSQGESTTVTMEWTVDLSDAQLSGSPPSATDNLVVESANSTDSIEVDIVDLDSEFTISIQGTNSPVNPLAETLSVDAKVENTDTGADTQNIWLEDFTGKTVDSKEVTLEGNSQKTITLEWDAGLENAGTDDIAVYTEDGASDTQQVKINEGANSTFEVVNLDLNRSTITAGEQLSVTAKIKNVGDEAGEGSVWLRNFDGTIVDSVGPVSLSKDGTTELDLAWNTDPSFVKNTPKTDPITVVTSDAKTQTKVVTIEPSTTDSNFTIDDVSLDPGDNITAGERLRVNVDLTNNGTDVDTKSIELLANGTQHDATFAELNASESDTFTLVWDTTFADAGVDSLTIATPDDDQTESVTIDEPLTNPQVKIESIDTNASSWENAVTAGGLIEVEVKLNATGGFSDTALVDLRVDDASDTPVDFAERDFSAVTSPTVSLYWQTELDDGNNEAPQTIRVRTGTDEEDQKVYVNKAPESILGSGEDPDENPVGINIDEIEVSS